MTKAFAIALLKQDIQNSKQKISYYHNEVGIEALEMAIKALMQQLRDCKTCKHSDSGNCAGTEECHECMWESKYEQQPSEDCISRAEALHACCDEWNKDYKAIMKSIRQLPSITPQQKVGKWIDIMVGDMPAQACDRCNTFYPLAYTGGGHKYCPNCGARMEVEE